MGAVLFVFVFLFVFLLGLFIFALDRYPEGIKRWATSLSIVITHLQTVAIISHLSLSWPPSYKLSHQWFLINGLSLEAARPECLAPTDVNLFYPIGLVRAALPLVLLLLVPCVRFGIWLLPRRRPHHWDKMHDKLELRETVVYQVQLCASWRVSFDLIVLRDLGVPTSSAAYCAAVGLIALQIVLAVKYWRLLRQLHPIRLRLASPRLSAGRRRLALLCLRAPPLGLREPQRAARCLWRLAGRLALRLGGAGRRLLAYVLRQPQVSPEQLEYRLQYLTERFRVPQWQFVIWARQLALFAVSTVPEAAELLGGAPATLDLVRKLHAVLALLLLLGAWALHVHIKPYAFRMQNDLENFLFAATVAMTALGTIYTFIAVKSAIVEALIFIVLIGSVVVSIARVTWAHAAKPLAELGRPAIRVLSPRLRRRSRPTTPGAQGGEDEPAVPLAQQGNPAESK